MEPKKESQFLKARWRNFVFVLASLFLSVHKYHLVGTGTLLRPWETIDILLKIVFFFVFFYLFYKKALSRLLCGKVNSNSYNSLKVYCAK